MRQEDRKAGRRGCGGGKRRSTGGPGDGIQNTRGEDWIPSTNHGGNGGGEKEEEERGSKKRKKKKLEQDP